MSDHDLVSRAVDAQRSTSGPALRVGSVDDPAEREADVVADRVVDALRRSGPNLPSTSTTSSRAQRSASALDGAPAGTDQHSRRDSPADDASAGASRVQRSAVIAGGASSSDRQRVIRRAPGHFSSYLASKDATLDPATNATDREHLLAAWILDQNIYDLEAMVTGNSEPDLQNLAFLSKIGQTPKDALALLQSVANQAKSTSPMDLFQAVVRAFPTAITKRVSGATKATAGKEASEIRWHGLTGWGAGSGVTLVMKPGGLPAGSTPKSEPVWMKTIEQHHPPTNSTSLYVRGHLLNHNIGGPGLDYNMVPITGKPAKNVGGNDANAEHLIKIEKKAKETWDEVRLGKLATATYEVVPSYPQPARPETQYVWNQAVALRKILDTRRNQARTDLANLPAQQQQAALQNARQFLPPGIPDNMVFEMIAQQQSTNFERQTLAQLVAVADPVATAITTQLDQKVLNASTEGTPMGQTLQSLLSRVEGNAAAWRAEEMYVPLQLAVRLDITDLNGITTTLADTVPVTLSTDVAGVHYRPFKKNEL
jgi:hypothetical protein